MYKKFLPIIIVFAMVFLNLPVLASVDIASFDFNDDGVVDQSDVDLLQDHWLQAEDHVDWDPQFNLNVTPDSSGKQIINYLDLNIISDNLTVDLSISNIQATDLSGGAFTIKWQTNGNYDCTMIYSTKDGDLDDDFLVSTRDADDYIFGSNFPKSNSSGVYYYEIKINNSGEGEKYFDGDKGYLNLICYDDNRNKNISPVYSFDIPESDNSKGDLPDLLINSITYSASSMDVNGTEKIKVRFNVNYQNRESVDIEDDFYISYDCGPEMTGGKFIYKTIHGNTKYMDEVSHFLPSDTNLTANCKFYIDGYIPFSHENNNKIVESYEDNNIYSDFIVKIGDGGLQKKDLAFIDNSFKYYTSEGGDGYTKGTKLVYIEVEDRNKIEEFTHGFFSFTGTLNGITEVFAPKVVSNYVLGFTINLAFFGELNDDQQYNIDFKIDEGNVVDESNESNNNTTKSFKFLGETDNPGDDEQGDNIDDSSDDDASDDDDTASTNKLVLQLQRQITALEKQVIELEKKLTQLDQKFADKYSGTMFLDVENHGRLWYVDPESKNRFYFENGVSALSIGSKLATGISYEDIQKIPVGVPDKLYNLKDSDGDGLPDRLESALGSDPNNSDSDGDGYSDKEELENGYSPISDSKYSYDQSLIDRLEGKMLLQVSGPNSHGEIWYIKDGKRWYGGTEDSMYEIMKARSLGAKPGDIRKIAVGEVEGVE